MPSPSITYVGDVTFQDLHTPTIAKNEWGVDVLTREMSGAATGIMDFMAGLSQGKPYTFQDSRGTRTFYLQTWDDDKNPVFPKVTLIYKGLFNGIPNPHVSGETIQASMSRTTDTPVSITFYDYTTQANVTKNVTGTIDVQYRTRRALWKYIVKSTALQSGTTLTYIPPAAPSYTVLDVNVEPVSLISKITTDAGVTFSSNAPAALATALTPAAANTATMKANPVWGTPYFECEDTVDRLLF